MYKFAGHNALNFTTVTVADKHLQSGFVSRHSRALGLGGKSGDRGVSLPTPRPHHAARSQSLESSSQRRT